MCDEKSCNYDKAATFEEVQSIVNHLKSIIDNKPQIGILCGTGLGGISSILKNSICINYRDIPSFPVSTVAGHAGQLYFGYIGPSPVICMKDRFHYYEGYSLWECTLPVRVMKLLGVTALILSNAAGGINKSFKPGDIMVIKDHINFLSFGGNNPLRGLNDDRFGPRFPIMSNAYDKDFTKLFKEIAKEMKVTLREGIYAALGGPSFETIAELKALRTLGADCVGMSTVHEVIVARHCGIKCFAFSLITNICGMDYETNLSVTHEETIAVGFEVETQINRLVERFLLLLVDKLQ